MTMMLSSLNVKAKKILQRPVKIGHIYESLQYLKSKTDVISFK